MFFWGGRHSPHGYGRCGSHPISQQNELMPWADNKVKKELYVFLHSSKLSPTILLSAALSPFTVRQFQQQFLLLKSDQNFEIQSAFQPMSSLPEKVEFINGSTPQTMKYFVHLISQWIVLIVLCIAIQPSFKQSVGTSTLHTSRDTFRWRSSIYCCKITF